MTPIKRLVIAAIVLIAGAGGFATGRVTLRPERGLVQPIAFNHQKHTGELGLECDACHEFLQVGQHAGLPALSTCLMCHEEAQTESPEEQKIRDLTAEGQDDVFRKLFRLADHAYYSHRRHAIVAEIPCATCHGAIAETTSPPERPLVRIDMPFCIECHERESVTTHCTACHR